MNYQLQNYVRETLKENLVKCTNGQQLLFKRMYSHGNLDASINNIVDLLPKEKLGMVMQQVERTLAKNQCTLD